MNNSLRNTFLILSAYVVTTASAANMSGVDITAKEKRSGKVVYQGKTDAAGKFATSTLEPGKYLIELRSKEAQGFQVALGGTKTAKQVNAKDGLAFDIEIDPASKVSGKVTGTPMSAAQQQATAKNNKNVRIINGKRYVWVGGQIGSQMGGKWIPEEEAEAMNPNASRRNAGEGLQRMQDLGAQGGAPGR
ncbi:MAG TPA: carboxypeptidase-like regulatory domain-containing protein [Chthoniobacterales bacterium]|nr:carboxypeptidase-like regulatory domain-containing protein [Chthoniobacterales bacterium]